MCREAGRGSTTRVSDRSWSRGQKRHSPQARRWVPRCLSRWPFLSFLSPFESSMLIYFLWAIIYYLDFSCVFFLFLFFGGAVGGQA